MLNQLLSNRVEKTPSTEVSADRYEYLALAEAEPDLGVPAGNTYILASTTTGTRSWINPATALPAPGSNTQLIFNNSGVLAGASSLVYDTATGQVGIGTGSPTAPLTVYNATSSTILVSGDSVTSIIAARSSNDTTAPGVNFRKYRGTTATPLTVSTSDSLGNLNYNGYDGTSLITAAQITGVAETVGGTGDISGALTFLTRPAGSGTNATERVRITSSGNVGFGTNNPSAKLDVVGDIEVNSNVNLNSEAITLATLTKTQIASFPVASFRSGKLIVQAYDSVSGEVQISELLVAHNGTTATATEYGVVHTGSSAIVVYDVDINSGNVRLMATRTTTNSTQYKISETLIVA